MSHIDGALARNLDFDFDDVAMALAEGAALKPRLRLSPRSERLHGPDKYKVLDHRRHQAQIKARRLLDLI